MTTVLVPTSFDILKESEELGFLMVGANFEKKGS